MAKNTPTNIIKNYKTGEIYTQSELKAWIKKKYNLRTEREYKNFRQKALNRLHNYETITGEKAPIDLNQYLFQRVQNIEKYGKGSRITREIDAASSASAQAYKKTRERAQEKFERAKERAAQRAAKARSKGAKEEPPKEKRKRTAVETRFVEALRERWAGVIRTHHESKAAKLFEQYDNDEITAEELAAALIEYGKSLNARQAAAGAAAKGKASRTKNAYSYE